jgi:hypothetical protein
MRSFVYYALKVFDFLHEHHIVHFDFLSQNLGINVLSNVNKWWTKGLLQRSVTRYALFDFGQSKQYPLDIPIDEVQDTRFFGFDLRGYPEPEGPYNPFQVEMLSVGDVLQRNVRVRYLSQFLLSTKLISSVASILRISSLH